MSLVAAPKPHLIVDFDKPGSPLGPHETRCDYLFIAERGGDVGLVAPLELKRGRLHVRQVVGQLQAGASAAETLVAPEAPIELRPVAASRGRSKAERNRLKGKGNKIRLHGRLEAVRLMSCGAPLVEALRR